MRRIRLGGTKIPPLVSAPARRARLLGCLASPRLLASGHHSASPVAWPVYPSCLHLPGAGVSTQGTSHWGHPLGESNAPCRSSFAALSRSCLKALVIYDGLLPSEVVGSGGLLRLKGGHREYLRTLISPTTQPHPSNKPPIIYQPCLCAVIVNCTCVTCPSSIYLVTI